MYKIDEQFLLNTIRANRKSYVPRQMVELPMTLSELQKSRHFYWLHVGRSLACVSFCHSFKFGTKIDHNKPHAAYG